MKRQEVLWKRAALALAGLILGSIGWAFGYAVIAIYREVHPPGGECKNCGCGLMQH